jgi:hypothetical protein
MGVVTTVYGQTFIDVCNEVYANINNIVQLCRDNNITDINFIPETPITVTYNNDIQQLSNTKYATRGYENTNGGHGYTDDYDLEFYE